jgi:Uncharacterized conserved protein
MSEGGDAACWLSQVCAECGRIREERDADVCEHCGAPVEGREPALDITPSDITPSDPGCASADTAPPVGPLPSVDSAPDAVPDQDTALRDRDAEGRARNARPRDGLGRPLPYGTEGVERQPEGVRRLPVETLEEAQSLLDAGKPFHAHEVFEDAWKMSAEPERVLWRSLAQFAVGLTHAARGNTTGATTLLGRAAQGIALYGEDAPYGISAAALATWAQQASDGLAAETLGPVDLRPPRLRG